MINKDSIVTAYDEHLTLVEWLQKVSKALNESVLTNLGIAKLSDQGNVATYQVKATFADNTAIASDSFTLPSTDIVTAFDSLKTLVNGFDSRITKNTSNVSNILDIVDIAHDHISPYVLQNSINGSDDLIVDVDKTNDKLEIHLSPDLTVNSLTATTIKMENYIHPASILPSEGDITISKNNINEAFREVYSFHYGHWRISNGILSIIVCPLFYNATETGFSHDFDWIGYSDDIILPKKNLDKLQLIVPGGQNIISAGSIETQGIHSDGNAYPNDQLKLMFKITKTANAIRVGFDLGKYEPLKIGAGTKYAFRLEENFVL